MTSRLQAEEGDMVRAERESSPKKNKKTRSAPFRHLYYWPQQKLFPIFYLFIFDRSFQALSNKNDV